MEEGIIMKQDTTRHDLAAAIHEQIHGEAGARMDYENLLYEFREVMDTEDVATIQEISGDEFNHTLKLLAMARKYDGAIAPAADGAAAAIEQISSGIVPE